MSRRIRSAFTGLVCTECFRKFRREQLLGLCPHCRSPVDTVLDDEVLKEQTKDALDATPRFMWRFRSFLPVNDRSALATACEGGTPLRRLSRLPGKVWLKDETRNPTGTFKDRGASLATTRLSQLGAKSVTLSSEGNAGCSFALYCGMIGMSLRIFLPRLVNQNKVVLSRKLGATVVQVPGTIADAGKQAQSYAMRSGAYNASTFVTPYRHDGKGTMALEICEQMEWEVPDWIVYPIGGGVGLVGMWKMLKILEKIDWIRGKPRFVGVQPSGCAPAVKAFNSGREDVEEWPSPKTSALGLKIPKPLAGRWILRSLRESKGVARTVSERQIRQSLRQLAKRDGVLVEPSSAAAFAALHELYEDNTIEKSDRVVVIGTGSGLKTLEAL